MMDWTDRHQRMLMRCITRRALLYTEMVTPSALRRDPHRHLEHHPDEHPLAIQLGGSAPREMAAAAREAERWGYAEVNLNMGCPSPRVGAGCFGAALMKAPQRAVAVVQALADAVSVPVTVKMRLGVDDWDDQERLLDLVNRLHEAGAQVFVIHARKAWLQGLSPKENREVPPLQYPRVLDLKARRPETTVILNGGIQDLEQARHWLDRGVDGVMVGRAAYEHPLRWLRVDSCLFGSPDPAADGHQVLAAYLPYVAERLAAGDPLARLARHLLPLFQGCPGARRWRRLLSEGMRRPGAGLEVIERAWAAVRG